MSHTMTKYLLAVTIQILLYAAMPVLANRQEVAHIMWHEEYCTYAGPIGESPLMNDVRGIVQGGASGNEPLTDAGITGMNEVWSACDDGLNSNFIGVVNDPGRYAQPKILANYIPPGGNGDTGTDNDHGTGTTNCGVGDDAPNYDDTTSPDDMDGMAPSAQIDY